MTVVSLQEATSTYDCKIVGCPNEAKANRGTYAFLCEEHIELKRREFGLEVREGMARSNGRSSDPRPARPLVATIATSSFEGKAKQLVGLGKKVDQAFAAADRAKARCQPTLNAARQAKEQADDMAMEFKAALRSLLEEPS